jgi:hypothetical protein
MSFDYSLLGRKLRKARESLLIEPQEAAFWAHSLQIAFGNYSDDDIPSHTGGIVRNNIIYRKGENS